MKRSLLKYTLTPLALAIATGTSTTTFAAGGFEIEEIIVTSQRREQSLQDVPVAVQALGADFLEQNEVVGINDISALAPSVSNAGGFLGIRGVTTPIFGEGLQASTAIYLDGVYLNEGPALLGDLVDVARIEVLRGPQGTLFGRNAAAGAISVTTNAPTDVLEGSATVGVGNDNLRKFQGVVNVPLSDSLLLRAAGSYRKRDGNLDNASGGADFNEIDRYGLRAKLTWLASDDLTLNFSVDNQRFEGSIGPGFATAGIGVDPSVIKDIDDTSFVNTAVILRDGAPVAIDPDFGHNEFSGAAITANWELSDGLKLTSVTSYRESDSISFAGDNVLIANPVSTVVTTSYATLTDTHNKEFSQEFRLSGKTDTLDWFVGANYFESENNSFVSLAQPMAVGLGFGPFTGDVDDETLDRTTQIDSISVFGDAIISLTDTVNLTVGARYARDKTEVTFNPSPRRSIFFFAPVTTRLRGSDAWDDLSGRIVVDWAINDDLTTYASISQGYKSGGFNTSLPPTPALVPADPDKGFDKENSINYELGIKSTWMDGRLQANVTLFHTDYEGYQFQVSDPINTANVVNLGGDGISQGVELETTFLATENLTLGLSTTYLKAQFTKDVLVPGATIPSALDGQAFIGAPDFSTVVTADYLLPLGDTGDLRFNLTYSYEESSRNNNTRAATINAPFAVAGNPTVINESAFKSGSIGLLNARITFTSADERWSVSAWGNNLTDAARVTGSANELTNTTIGPLTMATANAASVTRNDPISYGLDFTYNFGG